MLGSVSIIYTCKNFNHLNQVEKMYLFNQESFSLFMHFFFVLTKNIYFYHKHCFLNKNL
jgi:hypothetical protein